MAVVPLLTVLVLAAAVALVLGVLRRSPPSREASVHAARRHARLAATAAVALGAAAALLVAVREVGNSAPGGLGVTGLLVPIVFGVVHTVVLAVGELTWPRPQGEVRRARLVRRGLLDAAPRWLVRTAAVATALAVAVLVGGARLADETGRRVTYGSTSGGPFAADDAGWWTAQGSTPGGALSWSTASPFPGLFYGRPAAIGLLALALVTVAALWVVANRPAVATEDERIETALRRASAHRVLRGAVGATLVVAGGLLLVGGMAVSNVGALPVPGWAGGLPGLLTMLAGLVVLCLRAPGVPVDSPTVPAR
ncbi:MULTISPECIES: hypothetical protein [unclassified Modestobacter]|uniref:hypothetical protein n=1 Tax=unclassified Modestobacter TaxID=2643866 RepID=UPI0022AA9EE8|nr:MULTISPECIES: hypothetical protein [unclassified Modestobacter]MCZ2823172.1 hypothetical protein [Modestobacter sp. VKM Ac-2981]MCZ2851418.1 hypothetical protein [Modestobacter sp. VKM Ac-2982]